MVKIHPSIKKLIHESIATPTAVPFVAERAKNQTPHNGNVIANPIDSEIQHAIPVVNGQAVQSKKHWRMRKSRRINPTQGGKKLRKTKKSKKSKTLKNKRVKK
jgi:hypothetical protein